MRFTVQLINQNGVDPNLVELCAYIQERVPAQLLVKVAKDEASVYVFLYGGGSQPEKLTFSRKATQSWNDLGEEVIATFYGGDARLPNESDQSLRKRILAKLERPRR